jgi:CHAT domain-containing protein
MQEGVLEKSQKKKSKHYIAFAPSFDNNTDNDQLASLDTFRSSLIPLSYTVQEVENISRFATGIAYSGQDADEHTFKNHASEYQIIHLATHAQIDDQNPDLSKLVFSNSNDSLEDGYLHISEIYNMELDAELAVLSACNTGYGKLVRGEGLMSLARGFAYAGCPSIVMSLWRANDQSTATIMGYFYESMSEGFSKDDALRQAKLKYLESSPGATKKHPYFWAPFVVIGNPDSIEVANKSGFRWWLFLIPVGLSVLWFIVRSISRR